MRQSPVYFLDIPFEQRLNYILAEYGTKSTEQLIECTQRLTKRLGGLDTKNTIAFLQEGDLREAFRILLRYYDKTYSKGLHNRENGSTLLHQVESNTVSTDNVSLLLSQYQAL
jgi:tRNA 2-selenouridine synthase